MLMTNFLVLKKRFLPDSLCRNQLPPHLDYQYMASTLFTKSVMLVAVRFETPRLLIFILFFSFFSLFSLFVNYGTPSLHPVSPCQWDSLYLNPLDNPFELIKVRSETMGAINRFTCLLCHFNSAPVFWGKHIPAAFRRTHLLCSSIPEPSPRHSNPKGFAATSGFGLLS